MQLRMIVCLVRQQTCLVLECWHLPYIIPNHFSRILEAGVIFAGKNIKKYLSIRNVQFVAGLYIIF